MAAGGQGQGDGGVGRAAGGDGGVPAGGRDGGAGGRQGRFTHSMKAQAYNHVLSRTKTQGCQGLERWQRKATRHSLRTGGRRGSRRRAPGSQPDKTAYAQHNQCSRPHETRPFTHSMAKAQSSELLEVNQTRLLTHSTYDQCSRPHETRPFTHSMAGVVGVGGTAVCRAVACLIPRKLPLGAALIHTLTPPP